MLLYKDNQDFIMKNIGQPKSKCALNLYVICTKKGQMGC